MPRAGVPRLPLLHRLEHCCGAVISSPHGPAQWEGAESNVLLYILKVKCLQIMLMDSSEDRDEGIQSSFLPNSQPLEIACTSTSKELHKDMVITEKRYAFA